MSNSLTKTINSISKKEALGLRFRMLNVHSGKYSLWTTFVDDWSAAGLNDHIVQYGIKSNGTKYRMHDGSYSSLQELLVAGDLICDEIGKNADIEILFHGLSFQQALEVCSIASEITEHHSEGLSKQRFNLDLFCWYETLAADADPRDVAKAIRSSRHSR